MTRDLKEGIRLQRLRKAWNNTSDPHKMGKRLGRARDIGAAIGGVAGGIAAATAVHKTGGMPAAAAILGVNGAVVGSWAGGVTGTLAGMAHHGYRRVYDAAKEYRRLKSIGEDVGSFLEFLGTLNESTELDEELINFIENASNEDFDLMAKELNEGFKAAKYPDGENGADPRSSYSAQIGHKLKNAKMPSISLPSPKGIGKPFRRLSNAIADSHRPGKMMDRVMTGMGMGVLGGHVAGIATTGGIDFTSAGMGAIAGGLGGAIHHGFKRIGAIAREYRHLKAIGEDVSSFADFAAEHDLELTEDFAEFISFVENASDDEFNKEMELMEENDTPITPGDLIIAAVIEGKPADVKEIFDAAVKERAAEILDEYKEILANESFNGPEDEDEEDDEDDDDDEGSETEEEEETNESFLEQSDDDLTEEELNEMRKETDKVVSAFVAGRSAKGKRTNTDGQNLYLHGNLIARKKGEHVHATLAGWGTTTTRERLNGLTNHLFGKHMFHQAKHTQHFNGKPIGSRDWVNLHTGEVLKEGLEEGFFDSSIHRERIANKIPQRGRQVSADANWHYHDKAGEHEEGMNNSKSNPSVYAAHQALKVHHQKEGKRLGRIAASMTDASEKRKARVAGVVNKMMQREETELDEGMFKNAVRNFKIAKRGGEIAAEGDLRRNKGMLKRGTNMVKGASRVSKVVGKWKGK